MRCTVCGKYYERNGSNMCNECKKKDYDEYMIVRGYIATHREVNAMDINRDTGIPIKTILGFIKDGRIELKKR